MNCAICERYDLMGFGPSCPCKHMNGKCVNPAKRIDTGPEYHGENAQYIATLIPQRRRRA